MRKKRPDAPSPKPGTVKVTRIPSSFEGIQYELSRIVRYIQDGRKDPLVISTAREIGRLAIHTARHLGLKVDERSIARFTLEGVHAWCRDRFEYMPDPAGVELIQTPNRMLRSLRIPESIVDAMWTPIRDAMTRRFKKSKKDKMPFPAPKMTGDSDEAVTISLALAAALGLSPLKLRLGGHGGVVHYVWGAAWMDGKWVDLDILHNCPGKHYKFETYAEQEVPLF